ncbi:hypothetical protein A5733_22810 [Mycobacterium sp. NS-7484]|uniref:hypothetical protein n=1 Tax=Mycobacterium sp. NS-7484 TaxID=1834161 RepID=UPI00096EFDEB|nr:hypothetical protein [Mycobacterium sp. NS-7484]OMC03920.1 hypothetical protein A5733_22810 [Mycobacterium sp. NS-7484]
MNSDLISEAIILSISGSAIPRVDREKLMDRYGPKDGSVIADQILEIVKEAVAMPLEWGNKPLAQGVNDIMVRFGGLHPELSPQALREIGRCVGWQLR